MEYIKFGMGLYCLACSVPMLVRLSKGGNFSWVAMAIWGVLFAVGGTLVNSGI